MNEPRVLIVEDDAVSAAALAKLLEAEGYLVVDTARTGEQAVAKASQHAPDIVLMDIAIEGDMDGVEAANAIQRRAEVPIVYITGYSDSETVERAEKTSPFGYALKPFKRTELAITLRMALYKHQMDRKLRESELQLSSILASVPSAVIKTAADGTIDYMNPMAELFARRSHERVRGLPLWDVLELRSLETGEPVENPRGLLVNSTHTPQLIALGSGSDRRVVEPWCNAIADSLGEVQSFVLVLRDITQQYEAEQSQRILAAALMNLEDAVLIAEPPRSGQPDPTIIYANSSFERIAGWTPGQAAGKPLSILRDNDGRAFWDEMLGSLAALHPWQGEGATRARSGQSFTGQWAASVIRQANGAVSHYVFGIRDVTHMRKLEDSIAQSQKIEAVGRLAGGIAHDFNNLLSVINSYCDLQVLKLEEGTPAMKYARQIRAAGRKGAELVSQLMTFSRRDKPNPCNMDLSALVHDVQGMLRRVIREDIELETHLAREVRQVRADQGQVEQALLNLCVNARDAMPNGGRIQIEVFNRDIAKPIQTSREVIRAGSYVVLAVTDTGCGIDEQTQQHIFDPFFTTKEIGKGTGLGLATVFGIMKQSNGYVTVKSRAGEGARFELVFPTTHVERLSDRMESEDSATPRHGHEVVLVVEDDETFLDCISGLLSLNGYEVYTAGDGQAAVDQMQRLDYKISLLVSDLVLPKLSGREVAARLLDKSPETKVVFMTGYDDQLDSFYSLPGDAMILEKPFPLNQLLVKVRELLDSTNPAEA